MERSINYRMRRAGAADGHSGLARQRPPKVGQAAAARHNSRRDVTLGRCIFYTYSANFAFTYLSEMLLTKALAASHISLLFATISQRVIPSSLRLIL